MGIVSLGLVEDTYLSLQRVAQVNLANRTRISHVTAVRQLAKLNSLESWLGNEMSDADDSYTKMPRLKRLAVAEHCMPSHHTFIRN